MVASTKAPAFLSAPCWSPDGTKIVVSKYSGVTKVKKGSALLVVDVATGAVTTLRKASKSLLMNPSWQPLPPASPPAGQARRP